MNEQAIWHLRRAAWVVANFRQGVFGQNWRGNPQWAIKRAIYRLVVICWHLRSAARALYEQVISRILPAGYPL